MASTFDLGAILTQALPKHGTQTTWAPVLPASNAGPRLIVPLSVPTILQGVAAEATTSEYLIAGFGSGLLMGGALMAFVFVWCGIKGWAMDDGSHPQRASEAVGAVTADFAVIALLAAQPELFTPVWCRWCSARSHAAICWTAPG